MNGMSLREIFMNNVLKFMSFEFFTKFWFATLQRYRTISNVTIDGRLILAPILLKPFEFLWINVWQITIWNCFAILMEAGKAFRMSWLEWIIIVDRLAERWMDFKLILCDITRRTLNRKNSYCNYTFALLMASIVCSMSGCSQTTNVLVSSKKSPFNG